MNTTRILSFLLTLFLLLNLNSSFAQQVEAQTTKEVSKISDQLNETTEILDRVDSVQQADSATRLDLESELSQLRSSDRMMRTILKAKIDSIKKVTEERNVRIKNQVDSLRENVAGIPVVFNKDTIFSIYSKLGPFQAIDRALTIQGKIEKLAGDYSYSEQKFRLEHGEESSDVYYDEIILLSVTDRDAFWMDTRRQDLAMTYKYIIEKSIANYLDENDLVKMFFRIILMLVIILGLYYMVKYMNKWFSLFLKAIAKLGKRYFKGLHIGEYEILNIEKQRVIVLWFMNVIKWFVIAVVLYLSVPLIFSLFPATENVANTMIEYVSTPLVRIFWSAVGFIPELVTIAIILVLTYYFVRFLRFLSVEIEHEILKIPGFYPDWARPTYNLLRIMVYAFAFAVIYPYLPGSNSPVFQMVLIFLALLIALGSMSSVANVIAGLVITYMRPFKIGDRVKVGETVGDVVEKTLLITRIRTLKNVEVTVPNSAILNGQTVNFSSAASTGGLKLSLDVFFSAVDDREKIERVLMESALLCDGVLTDPKPHSVISGISDSEIYVKWHVFIANPNDSANVVGRLCSKIVEDSTNNGLICKSVEESDT